MGKPRVFVDSSVIIAALLSNSGGSYYLLTVLRDRFEFITNQYVLMELEELLHGKFSSQADLQNKLFLLLGTAHVQVLSYPSKKEVNKISKIISKKDAPILAGALPAADYLLTLDNEFLTEKVSRYAMEQGLKVTKPGDLIKEND
jgi:putative PIN family toxin of toxin-antitoxin system